MCLLIRGVLRQTKLGLVVHILIKLWCDRSRSKTVLEMHDQNRIIVYRSKSTTNNFYSSAKFVFILGRCFGVLPVHRLAKLPADVHFRWGSLWVVYSLLLASLMVFGIIVSHAHPHESFTLSHWATTVFYLFGIVTLMSHLQLARRFREFIADWTRIEEIMNHTYGYPDGLDLNLRVQSAICIGLHIGKNVSTVDPHLSPCFEGNILLGAGHCTTTGDEHKDFFENVSNDFHGALKIMLMMAATTRTCVMVYNDLFIIAISICLALRFEQFTRHISQQKSVSSQRPSLLFTNPKKFKSHNYWKQIRRNYNSLCVLCRNVDAHVSFLVLLSFSQNVFFVLTQMHHVLRIRSDNLGMVYFWYSLLHVLFQLVLVTLNGAWVNDASKKPKVVLEALPSATHNNEVSLEEIWTNDFPTVPDPPVASPDKLHRGGIDGERVVPDHQRAHLGYRQGCCELRAGPHPAVERLITPRINIRMLLELICHCSGPANDR
ncbi:gustatory receptor for sugar taste 64e-like isoform X3 [Tenebrio molitor]|uniref:gustatory receptor for sugar taste 64e-like isoform X3 n=1 Tax=Tenebrio molitor TaxID=7067 RepID=UPI003624A92E